MTNIVTSFSEPIEAMETAGLGAMQTSSGNLPLKRVSIRSRVDGLACQTSIAQGFFNPHEEFVEATYIFPLPGRFAVIACTMQVGDRTIEAELRERGQARADYDRAIRAGHRAAIAEEERSETFSLRVGNIPPLAEVSVTLTLVGDLTLVRGEATLRIPLVVAPRYVAGSPLDGQSVGAGVATDTDQVPDASRVSPPTLLPGFPNPVELSVEVELNLGKLSMGAGWRSAIRSSLHCVFISDSDPCVIRLLPGERLNRDFIIRFPVLTEAIQSVADYSHLDDQALGTFRITLLPHQMPVGAAQPRDVVFLLDRSGSMGGWKIVAARRAVARMIDSLGVDDRFQVFAFDDKIESPSNKKTGWLTATDRHRWQVTEWIAKVDARGGTELGGALRAALQSFATSDGMPAGRQAIAVVITDGQVAGEDSVLKSLASLGLPRLPRIFTLGIDRAVNASMLTRLAEMGGGQFELVESEDRLDQVLERFHRQITAPILTDIQIEPIDFEFADDSMTPQRISDVFADWPMTVYGRVSGHRSSLSMRISARDASGAPWKKY